MRDVIDGSDDCDALSLKHRVETARELAIVITNQKTEGSVRSANIHPTCRACCVTHSASGCAVQPARCLRRLAMSVPIPLPKLPPRR